MGEVGSSISSIRYTLQRALLSVSRPLIKSRLLPPPGGRIKRRELRGRADGQWYLTLWQHVMNEEMVLARCNVFRQLAAISADN
ncbi:hypothetical protein BaRGS_00022722 [Batillaria attramentaria]|uniref:Uncharacterized protein n=1 Tax=Batillaria attramentaria TaxID=370345 RepID=A0ABD0KFW6_9CAEN